jgi:hypothetical protein
MKQEDFNQAIEEFKQVYKEEFGNDLSNTEATIKSADILQLFVCLVEKEGLQ